MALKDVSLTNVKDGVAGSFSLGSIEAKSEEGTFSFGKISAANVDFHALLGTFGYVPLGASSDPMKVIYQDVSFDGGTLTTPQVKCTIGKASFGQSQSRPLKISYADAMKAMPKDNGGPSPDSVDTVVRYYADALKSSIGGPFDFDGLSCAGQDGSNKPFELTVGKVHVDASTMPGTTAPSTVEGIKIVGDGSTVTLGMLGLKAIDFNPAIAAVEAETSKITADWLMQHYRKLIPSFGGFSFSGLGVNGPDPESPGSTDRRQGCQFRPGDVGLLERHSNKTVIDRVRASKCRCRPTRLTIRSRCCSRSVSTGSISASI